MDVEEHRQLVFPFLAVEVVQPVHFLSRDERVERFLFLVEADRDDLETLLGKLLVSGPEMRQLGHAGTAPGRPEINQYDLSLEFGGVNLATGSVAGHLERF